MTPAQAMKQFRAAFENFPQIMGILNVTPDSFYDGGRFDTIENAVRQADAMLKQGAGIIDVGGESTRPGFTPVAIEEEIERVAPIIEALSSRFDCPLSIDTTKARVADAALKAGAHIINDVWGLQLDADMPQVAASHDAGVIIMHNRQHKDANIDILSDMEGFFATSLGLAAEAGIEREAIMLDPGVGFGKTPEQNLQVIRELEVLSGFGMPILMGLSRKSFIGLTIGDMDADRLAGTIAANMNAIANGARVIRVHDVAEHFQALRIWAETYKRAP